jgi:hypothetical protein
MRQRERNIKIAKFKALLLYHELQFPDKTVFLKNLSINSIKSVAADSETTIVLILLV